MSPSCFDITRFGTSREFLLRYVLGQWGLQPQRDVALNRMGGSQETVAGLAAKAIDGGMFLHRFVRKRPRSALTCLPN